MLSFDENIWCQLEVLIRFHTSYYYFNMGCFTRSPCTRFLYDACLFIQSVDSPSLWRNVVIASCQLVSDLFSVNFGLLIHDSLALFLVHVHTTTRHMHGVRDWLIGFNSTFSVNRLYGAFEKYVAVKKVKLIGESWQCCVLGIHTINHYRK